MQQTQIQSEFRLDLDFIASHAGRQPSWGPVGYVTYKDKYARSLEAVPQRYADLGADHGLRTSEEFWLSLTRVTEGTFGILQGHCAKLHLPWDPQTAQQKAQEMYRLMWAFKFLPPGRGLWAMGTDAVRIKGGAVLNNCGFTSTASIAADFAGPFCWLMDMSMLGVGVGFDTAGAGLVEIVKPARSSDVHVVEDSREGWIALLRRTLNAHVGRGALPGKIDVSGVRERGSLIKTFGGTASGPEPLLEMIESIQAALGRHYGRPVSSEDIVDVGNITGRCVVAGNVRRSAEIAFGRPDDLEFLALKDPEVNAARMDSHGWVSNNSVFAEVGQDYRRLAEMTARGCDLGYMWLDNARRWGRMGDLPDYRDARASGGNPCLEQTLEDRELCCLVESFPAHHDSPAQYQRTLKFAYLYAKAVTLVPTHDERTNAVLMRNRRIGCSMSGIAQSIGRLGAREHLRWCDESYRYVQDLDEEYSGWLAVPRSVKTTSVKPSGTVSLLCGATSGIHWPKAEYAFRVNRLDSKSPIVAKLRAAGYRCVDLDHANEPNTTACYFPLKERHFTRSIKDVTMWEQLEIAAQHQALWADNQVSVTVEFDPATEGPQIARALELYETRLKGVSFLPKSLDGTVYQHAPFQPITREEYEAYVAGLRPLDLSDTEASSAEQDRFCDGGKCALPWAKVPA